MDYETDSDTFNIKIGGEGYYTNDKEYQKHLSTYQKLKLRYGEIFFTPKYITYAVLMTLFDFLLIIADLIIRLYSNTFKSLVTVEKVISYILIALRTLYFILLLIKLTLNGKQVIKNIIYTVDAVVVLAAFVLVLIFKGLNRIAFCLVIIFRLVLTVQMIRNSNRRMKEKQEDEINIYSKRMDEQLQREKTVRKHIQDQIDDNKKKIQLLTGGY